MTFRELMKDLEAGQYNPVYFLQGDEPYFIDMVASYFETEVLTEAEKAFNFRIMYGKDTTPEEVAGEARRYPMGAERQVVIVKEAQSMPQLKKLDAYLDAPAESTILVLCHKHGTIDGRTSLAQKLKKKHVLFTSKKLYENKVPRWIIDYVHSKGYQIEEREATVITDHLGTEIGVIVNELEKLFINVESGATITAKHIQEHIGISKEYNVFELQRALGTRDHLLAQQIVNHFDQNPKSNPPVMVVAALASYFGKVYMMHFLQRHNEKDIQKALGLNSSFFIREYRSAAGKYNRNHTEKVIEILKEYDLKIKGLNRGGMSDHAILKEMVFKIAEA